MKRKTLINIGAIVVLLITAVFVLRFVFGGPEDDWICTDKGWVMHGNPSSPMPATDCNFQ